MQSVSLRRSLRLTARQQAAARHYGPALRQKTSSLYYTVCPSSSIIKKIIQWKKQQEQTLPSLSLQGQLKTSAMFNFKKSSPENKDPNVSALEERVNALDQQNAAIMREMHNMTLHYFQQLERLERRITDFTDVWHPMMTSNIVRIKDELVAETRKDSQSYIDQNIKTLLPPCEKKQEISIDPLSGFVVIGSQKCLIKGNNHSPGEVITPVFLERNASYEKLLNAMKTCSVHFIVDSIAAFPEIKKIDLAELVNKDVRCLKPNNMVDIDGNVICSSALNNNKLEYSRVEKLDKAFAKFGVELLYEGKSVRLLT